MPTMVKGSGSYLGALLLSAAWLAACGGENGTDMVPSQPAGSGGTTAAPGTSGTGSSAGTSAGASGGAAAGAGGRPTATAGTTAIGVGGMGAAGMPVAPDAGMPDAGNACSKTSPDADGDGTPDCMDMMTPPTAADPDACKVGPITAEVRAEYKLNAFYTRFASADGTPIVATDKPVDEAVRRACLVVLDLSSSHPMARQRMRTDHVYFIMMAKTEKTVETPEYKSRGDLDARARGFGNNPGLCAEENVMCDRTTDRWRGESICVHEYSHVMHLYVWNRVDPMFSSKVNAAYANAVRTMGKYANTYAASNATEYFAEGVQNWYNTNLQSSRGEAGDGVHNHINTRAEFKAYDPMLYDLLATVLPDVPKYKDCYYYE